MKKILLTLTIGATLSLSSAFANSALVIVSNEEPCMPRAIVQYVSPEMSENNLALTPYNAEFAAEQLAMQQEKSESWGSWALNKASVATKFVGEAIGETGSETAKYLLALNMNYYGVKALEEITAYGIYVGTSLVAGPAAGNGAYYVTKGAFTAAHWVIPGFDGYIAGFYAPVTKTLVVDPLVNSAPAIAKATVSAASTCAGYAKNAYNYFLGS